MAGAKWRDAQNFGQHIKNCRHAAGSVFLAPTALAQSTKAIAVADNHPQPIKHLMQRLHIHFPDALAPIARLLIQHPAIGFAESSRCGTLASQFLLIHRQNALRQMRDRWPARC